MSFSQFDLLPASLAALKRMGITAPTPIQARALPVLLEGRDLIGQARTGSGKTLAFALPLLEYVEPPDRWVQALVLVPTRELAVQVAGVLEELARDDGVKVLSIFGGRSIGPQETQLRRGAHVVVGTPGRVLDLVRRGTLKLDRVDFAVVDEADEMLDRGFAPDVDRILGAIQGDPITALFSATMPDWVHQAARKHLSQPDKVMVDSRPEEVPDIEHLAYRIPETARMEALTSLLDRHGEGTAIVFGRTKRGVRRLAGKLEKLGYDVACLQGNMSQNARDRVMDSFRRSQVGVLVATNVAARGLDVDHVGLVVNYELPENADLLTHRVGRTGRMGRTGSAFTLLTPSDAAKWRDLQKGLGRRIESVRWEPARSRRRA